MISENENVSESVVSFLSYRTDGGCFDTRVFLDRLQQFSHADDVVGVVVGIGGRAVANGVVHDLKKKSQNRSRSGSEHDSLLR